MKRTAMIGTALSVVLTCGLATIGAAQDDSSTIDPCTTNSVRATGEIIWGGLDHDPLVFEPGDGSQHIRDFVFLSRLRADDDRLEGATTATIDWDLYRLDRKARNRAGVNRGTFRIDGAAGSWEGRWTGVAIATDSWRALLELTGSGAYEGLSATLFSRSGERGALNGVIYPTDLASCDFTAAT